MADNTRIILVNIIVVFTATAIMVRGTGAKITKAKESITISCTSNDTLDTVAPLTSVMTPRKIVIENCPVPHGSYASQLSRINLNVVPQMTILFLKSSNLTSELSGANFDGLKIRTLSVSQYFLRDDILDFQKSLQIYNVGYSTMPKLPDNHTLAYLALTNGKFKDDWGNCGHINTMILKQWTVDNKTNAWLRNCSMLGDIRLQDYNYESLRLILIGLSSIKFLTLTNCVLSLNMWDGDLTKDATNLKVLNLSRTDVKYIKHNSFLHNSNLTILDLSYNNIDFKMFDTSTPFITRPAVRPVVILKQIFLDGNTEFQQLCSSQYQLLLVISLKVSLNDVGFTKLCFSEWSNMLVLSLRNNNIQTLEFDQLPMLSKLNILVINLENNPISIPSYTRDEYKVIKERYGMAKNVTILLDSIKLDCDCQHGWLAHAMRTQNLYLSNVRCSTGEGLTEVSSKQLECEKYAVGSCVIRTAWDNIVSAAECEGTELNSLPKLENVTRVNLRYNLIDDLQPGDFDNDIQFVDLRNNLISNVTEETAEAMFAFKNRTFLLGGNPILCTCDGLPLIIALQNHSSQIEDYDNITCSDGRLVKDVNTDMLCIEDLLTVPIWVTIIFAIMSLLLLAVFLIYRFSHKISLLFYTKGWCLFCFDDTDVYEERDYDAFLSFCHLDDDFIAENILPELDDYKLCIHYRDWMAGEWIPGQIAGSIARSHRTLIFLSKNFMASSWGMLEFRMALAAIPKDDCRRLVTIVLDDVVEEEQLDAELRNYLTTNTYIKWGDPWFFKKLRLVLPDRLTIESNAIHLGNEMAYTRAASQDYPSQLLVNESNYVIESST